MHASFLRNTRRTTDVKVRSLWKVKVLLYCFEWTQKWLMQKHRGRSTQRPEATCVLCLILCTYLLQYVYVFFQMCLSVYVLSDLGGSNCPCITHKKNATRRTRLRPLLLPHTHPPTTTFTHTDTHTAHADNAVNWAANAAKLSSAGLHLTASRLQLVLVKLCIAPFWWRPKWSF